MANKIYFTVRHKHKLSKFTLITEKQTRWRPYNQELENLNFNPEHLRPTADDYTIFRIPKKSNPNKFRKITAPKQEVKEAQSFILNTLQKYKVLESQDAFAYSKGRSTYDALLVHQKNLSRWFLKIDLKDFFNSHNREYIQKMMDIIYPLNLLSQDQKDQICQVALLNDELPQGSPLSPYLTNILFTPLDYELKNRLIKNFVYTRYADDIVISSIYNFDYKKTLQVVEDVLKMFNAPFKVHKDKINYGSVAGRNWILGWKLNKDNNITAGWKEKRRFKQLIYEFCKDTLIDNKPWPRERIASLRSLGSYYAIAEKGWINYIYDKYSEKFETNVKKLMSQQQNRL